VVVKRNLTTHSTRRLFPNLFQPANGGGGKTRRIRAVTGVDAYQRFREDEEIINEVTSNLRTSCAELPAMISKLQDELKKARREADELRLKIATGAAGSAASNGDDAREVAGVCARARSERAGCCRHASAFRHSAGANQIRRGRDWTQQTAKRR